MPETSGHADSKRAVIAAFFANLGIAVMKFVAFVFTGSSSMLSEGIHSVADTGNQGLLLLGRKRASCPPDEHHPFGYAPVQYFYSFIVAFVLFTLGGLFSIYEGIDRLRNPHELEDLWWAVAVLAGAAVMEGFSLRTVRREVNHVRPAGQSWWGFVRQTKSPDLPVVLLEDFAALVGLALAFVGIMVAHATDNARWDAAGSLAIGVLLVVVAVVLVVEMGSLLVGEAAASDAVARVTAAIDANPMVRRCIHLRTEQLGPDEIVVAAKVEFDHGLWVPELAAAIDALEADIRAVEPRARLIFVEPDVYRVES